ncbi:MAG: lysozyme, partial [Aquabacterium sp.]|nr:lysozyme [Aquabacterium sp.]
MQSPLTTSARGLELIRSFEKFEPKAYICPAGKLTIGYGHVIKASEPHLRSKTLTQGEAEALLRDDCR